MWYQMHLNVKIGVSFDFKNLFSFDRFTKLVGQFTDRSWSSHRIIPGVTIDLSAEKGKKVFLCFINKIFVEATSFHGM